MKKTTLFIAAAVAASSIGLFTLSGCGQAKTEKTRLKIVATTFPIYDWTREVLGERLAETDLVLLQQSGADLHSYSPSASDLQKIAACDLFVFVGGESDEWTERALAQGGKEGRRVLNLVKTLGSAAKEEKFIEGMEHEHHHHDAGHDHDDHAKEAQGHDKKHDHDEEHDHDEDKDHDHGDHDEHEHEIDEHVWLSLRHAATLVKAIAADLAVLDPANAATYRANADAYCAKLAALDREYTATVSSAKRKSILIADRFPFRYLADDYGLTYFAAFSGCSAESEASFKTVAFLAKKVDELQLPVILVIEGTKHKIAETVKRTTKAQDQRILTLDSLQSTGGEAAKTTHYLDVMTRNLEALKTALN